MEHQMKLADKYFMKIKDGNKIIELRLFDEKRQKLNIGDFIEFSKNDMSDKVTVGIKALYRYATFDEILSDFPIAYFGGDSKEEMMEEIHKFYPESEENSTGIIGIKFELIKK